MCRSMVDLSGGAVGEREEGRAVVAACRREHPPGLPKVADEVFNLLGCWCFMCELSSCASLQRDEFKETERSCPQLEKVSCISI